MRTCKTCGETKPIETGFNGFRRHEKTYYYQACKTCRNKEVKQKRLEKHAEKRTAGEADTVWTSYGAMTVARLHEYICDAHAACPILGLGLWTDDTPQRLGAW